MKIVNSMSILSRLTATEFIKLRNSYALKLVWYLPLLFVVLDLLMVGKPALRTRSVIGEEAQLMAILPLKALSNLWAGYFHPLMVALLPALLFRPEHRFKVWKHVHVMPVSPRLFFLSKTLVLYLLSAGILALVVFGLWVEWKLLGQFNPLLVFPFPAREMAKALGWLLLGSIPLMGLNAWISDRINSSAVPIMFGLIGLMLTISLSGQELDPSWRRDLIPWVLPYACVQQAIERPEARHARHSAAEPFKHEIDLNRLSGTEVVRLPSGRKITSTTTIPEYFLLPPPPTPTWLLAAFSAVAGASMMALGLLDARRKDRG